MICIVEGPDCKRLRGPLETMFADRKRLFVDLLDWDLPVVDGCFERDGFDVEGAVYLVSIDQTGAHTGSLRLLPTDRPHLLGSLFADLCPDGVPSGSDIFEITRLCLPARLGAAERLRVRNKLISTMVDFALDRDISCLTGVVEASFRAQVLEMGWRCAPLGSIRESGQGRLGAFILHIDAETPRLLAATDIYSGNKSQAHGAVLKEGAHV